MISSFASAAVNFSVIAPKLFDGITFQVQLNKALKSYEILLKIPYVTHNWVGLYIMMERSCVNKFKNKNLRTQGCGKRGK